PVPDLIPVSEALSRIEALVQPLGTEQCPLAEATGKRLSQPVLADRHLPPFDRVMMDGYAVRFADLQTQSVFRISGSAMAGDPQSTLPDEAGQAMEIMTGCPLPKGADTVIPVEDTITEDGMMRLADDANPKQGQFIHRKGSDYPLETELVGKGTILRSVEVGIAASCGYSELVVTKRPRVAVFGTGDELVPVEATPLDHQIRQSNLHALKASLPGGLADIQKEGHLADTGDDGPGQLHEAIAASDIVIISGAVSKGRLDWIPAALDSCGKKVFHGVSQRPGKPMGVWQAESGCLIFALPGNPVSTLVCAHRYILPCLRAINGIPEKQERVTLAEAFQFKKPLTLFLPVKRLDSNSVVPKPINNSGDYAGLAGSDGFIELQKESNHWTAGTEVPLFAWK
ncbi:MAG: molybdopterin molybdotransferase MoeA, partial [Puniceicoccaceae bacterium]